MATCHNSLYVSPLSPAKKQVDLFLVRLSVNCVKGYEPN